MRLDDGPALGEVVGRHANVVRVLAGHVHRVICAPFAGTLVAVAPSTYRQTDLCLRADRMIGYVAEPTGFLVHLLEASDCVTHSVTASHAGALLGAF
jgi:3',5'-cyclic-AMP phosphodiesterase